MRTALVGAAPSPPPFQYTQNLLTHTVILRQLKNLIEPTTIYYLCSTLCNVVYWDSSAELSVNCAMYFTCMCGKQFTVYRSRLTLFTVRPPPHTWLSAFNATLWSVFVLAEGWILESWWFYEYTSTTSLASTRSLTSLVSTRVTTF